MTSVDNSGTPGVANVILSSQYDAMNNRTQLSATIDSAADFLNTYAYDADQRMTQLVQQGQSGGNTVAVKGANVSYNALGQLATIFRTDFFSVGPQPDIATSTFSYDAGNRLTEIAYTYNGGTAIDAYSWTFDAANRVASMTTTTDGTAAYSYDNTNQVAGATYTGTGQPANESYTYDSNGNRTNTGYSTGTNNRLASDGTFNYAYDAEGNRTSRTRISNAPANDYLTTYTWDYRDRLTDVDFYNNSSVLTSHVHYTYDVFDHRISKSLDSTGSASYSRTEDYVYDGDHVVLDFVDPDGAGPSSLALVTRYLNGPGNAGVTDQVFAQEDAATGAVLWLLADNLGTTRDVVNNSSTVLGHLVYNSFGQLASGPTNLTRFLYTGQEWDADSGLQYNHHRWYDPVVGRWISQDPMGFGAGDTNVSRYCNNSATLDVDPTGLRYEHRPGPGGQMPDPAVTARFDALIQQMIALGGTAGAYASYLLNAPPVIAIVWDPASGGLVPGGHGPLTIVLNPNTTNYLPANNPLLNNLQNDPNGDIAAEIVIAHELGHAIPQLRLTDPGPNNLGGANVTLSENPARDQLNQLPRMDYDGTPIPDPDNVNPAEQARYDAFMAEMAAALGEDVDLSEDVLNSLLPRTPPPPEPDLPEIDPVEMPALPLTTLDP